MEELQAAEIPGAKESRYGNKGLTGNTVPANEGQNSDEGA